MKEILIINVGGTFNKIYNPITGELEIKKNNSLIMDIFKKVFKTNFEINIKGILYKDSLDMTKKDRKRLVSFIQKAKYQNIIIIHGTDTIDKTAKYINKKIKDRNIILTGAMMPYSIDGIEATSNLFLAYGYMQNSINGVYIALNGVVHRYDKIKKNRKLGKFEIISITN